MCNNIFICIICIIQIYLSLGCYNPFFPKTGKPSLENTFLTTPGGVPKQLRKAYENKRIDLFENLIYCDTTFKFYIEYNIFKLANLEHINKVTNLNMENVPIGDYLYLDYSAEHSIHTNLFDRNNEIVFTAPFEVIDIKYPSLDSFPDTLDAIIYTDKTKISITSDVILIAYKQRTYEFLVGEQVFFLKKDNNGLWKIHLWFELD